MLGADTARRELSSCCLSVSPARLVFGTAHAGESISLWLVGLVSLGSSRSIPKRLRLLRGEMGGVGTATAGRHPEPDLVFSLFFHPVGLRNPGINATFCGKRGGCLGSRGGKLNPGCVFGWRRVPDPECFPSHRQVCVGSPGQEAAGKSDTPQGGPSPTPPFPKSSSSRGFNGRSSHFTAAPAPCGKIITCNVWLEKGGKGAAQMRDAQSHSLSPCRDEDPT